MAYQMSVDRETMMKVVSMHTGQQHVVAWPRCMTPVCIHMKKTQSKTRLKIDLYQDRSLYERDNSFTCL